MGENNENKTLADVIREGFARQEAEQAAQGEAQVDAAQAENPAPVAGAEAPAEEQAPAQPEQPAQPVNQDIPEVLPQSQPAPAPAQAQPGGVNMMQYLMQRLQAAEAQNAQLAQQIQQAQATVQDQSKAAQNAIDTATNQPSVTVPVLDFNEMQYDDDATRSRKMQDWQNAMVQQISDAVTRQYAGQLQPIREDWENQRRIAEEEAARQTIWADSRFSDFKDRDEKIRQILNANPEIAQLGANKSYLVGGLMARGMDYNPNPSPEDIVRMVQNSPEAQKMLDTQRAQQIAERNQQIPTIQPSSGMATANAIPDNTPQTMDELRRRAAQRFGVQA